VANWKKLLWQMVDDPDNRGYTYDDAARVLRQLNFVEPKKPNGTHRRWRLKLPNGNVVVVGLVQKGHGTLKPGYIPDMVKALHDHGLIPLRKGTDDDLDT
jgi:hypothetical protein